ncbi:hypothetical protein ASG31_12675 [Chryseobacterium sp. Leaf404]|uniref:immunoglobulin domain-containing protein n=1 Tax=unclassified Chryseobacterium TaxID=2593645 RepID=UPI0006FA94E5|nr:MULTISPECIES: hypothetical protein [unclassified Chryseobacterium]KQT16364.1 hypothetical protein ASG31_12675 [Chryseobacterium sp. Leaf404]
MSVNWAKAATSLNYPDYWDGSIIQNGIAFGGLVGSGNIPVLHPGQEALVEIPWSVPNPQNFTTINSDPWHFCLLAKVNSNDDLLSYPITVNPNEMVRNNNNLAWKNLTVVDVSTGGGTVKVGGAIAVHNPKPNAENYNLDFFVENTEIGKPIFEEAEVRIVLDDILLKAWKDGGSLATNVEDTRDDHIKVVTGNNASLQNLRMDPESTGTLTLTYNFLTEEMTGKEKYNYFVTQKTSATNELLGGELYEIRKDQRPFFEANAGNNITVEKYEATTLSANNISESVTYNWYDETGDLIYSGKNMTVSNDITKKYKLEIVANDGFKDYSEVEVIVNPYTFKSLAPNPAINEVLVKYDIENATSAYISVKSLFNNTPHNYILDINTSQKTISLQNYPSGQYIVSLFVNGQLINSKNLIKN